MSTETKEKMMAVSMSDFNITDKSEQGIKMKLTLPDGTETEHFLMVRGADSPTFKRAQARTQRKNLDLLKLQNGSKKLDAGAVAEKQAAHQTELVAVLVVGWSFDQKPTKENIVDWLKTAPQIQEQVDQVAGDRTNFFTKPSSDCESSPKEVSG